MVWSLQRLKVKIPESNPRSAEIDSLSVGPTYPTSYGICLCGYLTGILNALSTLRWIFSMLTSDCLLPPRPHRRQHLTAAFGVRHSDVASATQGLKTEVMCVTSSLRQWPRSLFHCPGNLRVVVRQQSHQMKGTSFLSLLGRELSSRAAKGTTDIVWLRIKPLLG